MGFFDRNREQLANKGIDDARLPPGQYLTERFPVLHVGDVPTYVPGQWDLKIFGLVDKPFTINLDELKIIINKSIYKKNIEKENGRGVFLMKSLADEVAFNDSGNEVSIYFHNHACTSIY